MRTSDDCFRAFCDIKAQLPQFNLEFQTEADTRARIISRILRDVLDWPDTSINREEHANPGFMDYVLMTNKPVIVLEAKRSGDTFSLPPDVSVSRAFTLGGILRAVKNLQPYIDQVSKYCFQNGIEYAIVSNGLQWIIFRAVRLDGIHLGQSRAIVFKSFDDIEERFIDFWSLLSKPQVDNNSLLRAFLPTDVEIYRYNRLTDEAHSHAGKVSRNFLSTNLEPLLAEYMGEIADADSKDKLKHLFVKSRALEQVLSAVEQRITFNLSSTVRLTGTVVESKKINRLRAGLTKKLKQHLDLPPRGEVILLLGRVGSGKTTFVNHFLRIDLKDLLDKHILMPFDFRLMEPGGSIHKFFYEHLQRVLTKNKTFSDLSSQELRRIYRPEISDLTRGPLAALEKLNKKLYEQKIAEFLIEKYRDTETYLARVLRYLAVNRSVRCVFVFDNVDQLDFKLQQEVFIFAHSVSGNCHAFSTLAMWEETYLRSSQSGALATYRMTAYSIPPTSVVDIISRRLQFISNEIRLGGLAKQLLSDGKRANDIAEFLSLVRESILSDKRRARFFLESISMGNLRRAMKVYGLAPIFDTTS